ncbi:hypothetical protein ACGFIP_32180 [Micromonospora zamorensis]|uniref:hypothetical protein n=1 Tax=Micromonospora zamorensis TaxID=709883 RepID=UPI0037195BEC
MSDRLTDVEMRSAAARRPGYATYPQYRPSQPERLAPLRWPAADRDALVDAMRAAGATTETPPTQIITAADPDPEPLAELEPEPIFEFVPMRMTDLRWWRPRWSWAVMPANGATEWGYCWTLAGARRRTARAARRAARAMSAGGPQ